MDIDTKVKVGLYEAHKSVREHCVNCKCNEIDDKGNWRDCGIYNCGLNPVLMDAFGIDNEHAEVNQNHCMDCGKVLWNEPTIYCDTCAKVARCSECHKDIGDSPNDYCDTCELDDYGYCSKCGDKLEESDFVDRNLCEFCGSGRA